MQWARPASMSFLRHRQSIVRWGFGRKAVIDSHFVSEAVQLSKQLGVPVKVVWTREDDTRGGY